MATSIHCRLIIAYASVKSSMTSVHTTSYILTISVCLACAVLVCVDVGQCDGKHGPFRSQPAPRCKPYNSMSGALQLRLALASAMFIASIPFVYGIWAHSSAVAKLMFAAAFSSCFVVSTIARK